MGTGRSKKRRVFYFLGIFTLLLAFCVPAYAGVQEADGEYEIYPTPQSVVYGSGTTALTNQVDVTYSDAIDEYTKERITETLEVKNLEQSTAPNASNTKLIVGVYGSGDAADAYSGQIGVDDAFYNGEHHYDAYALWISNGTIVVLGEDVDASYYGVTTLKRILEQVEGKNIRNLTVKDYGQIEFRGFIEGYYGNPWSNEDRIDLMQFGKEIKMNQYIYAPKDDPLHNARWRDLYDEEDPDSDESLTKIADLARAGNESKCFFVYALHPFMNNPVNLSDSTYDAEVQVVKDKFEQVIRKAGVRQIAILEDDARGETAERMIRFLNDMQEWLEELKEEIPDLKTDILYCPTCYMNTVDAKMTAISEGVSDKIHIVVTGGRIWGEVSSEFSTAFYEGLNGQGKGRYPYMWVNWPCNDNTKDSQIMGGQNYILHTGVEPGSYEGIVLNPIQESESSKVGIFTASDYCWKIWQNAQEGSQAWDDAFKYIDHTTAIETEQSQALREVAKHQIAQAPNQPQVKFEESVELKPMLEEFQEKLGEGTLAVEDIKNLRKEFEKISEAADFYLEHGTNRRMAKQMTPFFSSLRDTTRADMLLMDAIEADLTEDNDRIWACFSEAQALYEQSKTYGFLYYQAGTLYAKAGRKYIMPFTEDILGYISSKVIEIVNPERVVKTKYNGTISYSNRYTIYQGDISYLTDGKDSTFVWFGQTIQAGDYVQMDLGEVKPVGEVQVLVGAGDADKWASYHLEHSIDGQNWTELPGYTGNTDRTDDYVKDLDGASARYVRIVSDSAKDKWAKFSEFSVYAPLSSWIYTNTEDGGWTETHEADLYSLSEKEGATLQPGEYVGLKLDRIHDVEAITIEGTGMNALTMEKSINAKEWKSTAEQGNARYIRIHNKTNEAVSFDLTKFEVKTKELYPMDLYEKTLAGNVDTNTRYWMDGDLSTKAKYQSAPVEGQYITYDLGQDIVLRSLRVYVLDTAIDYPRDAKIQISPDNETWTDVITIGDGNENGAEDKDTKPVESPGGGWTHDTVDVAYAYAENANIPNITARYVRLYFTAKYDHRWVELNEILVNGGEYIPSINDPTFEADTKLQRGYEPQMLNDGDLTTSFRPEEKGTGSLIYNLSDEKAIRRINILQSGSSISNAVVSVRTGADEWEALGTLDKSYSAFYTGNLENIYAIKLEWEDVEPILYEIITLEDPGNLLQELLDDIEAADAEVGRAGADVNTASAELMQAESVLDGINKNIVSAEATVKAAKDALEKLKAEVALQNLYAEKAVAEIAVAEKAAVKAGYEAVLAQALLNQIKAQAAVAEGDERKNLLSSAVQKDQEAAVKQEAAESLNQAAQRIKETKQKEQAAYVQAAADKQKELEAELNKNQNGNGNGTSEIKEFDSKNLKYEVLDASKKTVAVAGFVNAKKAKSSLSIPNTVKSSDGTVWNVVKIKDKAFMKNGKITKVTIGSKITAIGKQAFASCKKLKTINMKKASKITSIGAKAFGKISAKAKFTVPAKKLSKYKKMLKKAGMPKKASVKK